VFHTVVRGETLSKIAQQHLGNANKYPAIFDANNPILTNPDKIYPGQVLRIPAPAAGRVDAPRAQDFCDRTANPRGTAAFLSRKVGQSRSG